MALYWDGKWLGLPCLPRVFYFDPWSQEMWYSDILGMWFIWPCLKSTGDIQNLMLVEMSFHKDFDFEVIGVFLTNQPLSSRVSMFIQQSPNLVSSWVVEYTLWLNWPEYIRFGDCRRYVFWVFGCRVGSLQQNQIDDANRSQWNSFVTCSCSTQVSLPQCL